MKRKVLGLLLVVFLTLVAIGCNFSGGTITIEPGGEQTPTNIDLDEVFLNIESQIANKDSITNDITLPTKFGSVTVSWVSDDPNIIDANGHINRPDVDTTVILRCTLTGPTESKRYEVRVTIKAKEIIIDPIVQVASISSIISGELGRTYKAQGTVVATSMISFLIKDSTGYILCYLDTDYANDLQPGDEVEVEGATSAYGGAVQFNKPTYTKIGNTQLSLPTPRTLDKDSYEALNTSTVNIEYVKLEATLLISGKYYNLNFEGSTLTGSLCSPTQDVSAFDGKKIEVTGFFVYVSGSSTKYIYFMATEIKLSENQTPTPTVIETNIKGVKEGEVGLKYKIRAAVIATSNVSILLQDDSGIILAYFGNGYQLDVAYGDEIEFEGTSQVYKDTIQFNNGSYTKVGTKEISRPEAEVLTATSFDALQNLAPVTKYVKLSGKIAISGSYVNVIVEGATCQGSIVSPTQDVSALDGKNVTVEGYYLYINGSSPKYVNIMATNITLQTSEEPVVAHLDTTKQGTYYGDGVVVVIGESEVSVTDATGKVLKYTIYVEDNKYYVLDGGTKDYCTFGDGSVTNSKGTFTKTPPTPTPVVAHLDTTKQGTYYGDGVVVVIGESEVSVTDATGKVLKYTIYVEDNKYYVLDGSTKDYCTFGDGTVTNSKGTFTKNQPTPTPVVAHLDTTKQGTYFGDGVVVVIGESEVSVTDATGKVLKYTIYVEDNKYYVLDGSTKDYCTFGDGTVTNSKGTFTKTPPTPTSYTISDVKAGEIGKTYNIKATVVAVSAVSFLLQDDTDTILVYLGASYEKDLAVGDEIEFSGKTGTYSGTVQFTTAQYTKLGTKTISYPQPTVLSASDIDALVSATPVTQYVKVEAVLKISGNYVNLEIEGTKVKGSIVSPAESLMDYNNKAVIVTGYYLYVTGSSTKYVNFLMTEIEESTTPVPQLEDVTIAQVLAGEVGQRYRTMGTIVAVSAISLVLQDETGAIVCNFGSDFAYSTYRIGLKMAVEGPTQLHGGSVQINYPQVALLTEVGANYPEPRELELNDLLALNGHAPEYVMLTAKLVKSGKYYNLDMGDSYIFGALATPTEDIDGFVGKDIVVKGFYNYTTTSGDKTYVYFIYTSIEVVAASNGDEEIVDEIIASYTDFEFMDVVNNLLLPEGSDGVTMTWVSTNEDVLESNGTYHMPSEPTDVTFILTVSKGEVSKSTTVTFHVVGVESIASVKENTEYGSYHIIKGITIATAREGFVLQDETGMIYCSTASYRGDLQVGDEVIVKGPTQLYGNIVQIAKYELNYAKTGETAEVEYPEAITLDADAFASLFETTDIIFVQVSGTLEAGEYLSILNVEGTEIVGGLLHPNLMEYDGMDITVKGYFIDSVWGYKQFNQIVVTDVTVDSASNVDQNKVTRVVEDITKSFDGQKMYYPVNYYPDFEDVTVTWTSSNEDVFAIGEITKYQDTETVVTLTAVVECGEVSQTVVVNVIVPAITPTTGVTADDSEQTFVVCGTIVAATNESVLLQDNAGTILIYFGKYQCPEVLSVGAKIYYVGTVTTYAGIIEFNFGGYYVIEYLDVDYPEAIELNGEGCEALVDTTEVKYVKITGDLLINGSYVNFYPVGSELALSIISPNEDLTELNNYRITLTGYYVYTSGSSTKYPSIMMTDYEVYEWSDAEIVADIKATIDGLVGYTLYGGVSFTYRDDVDITWSSSNEAIIANDLTYNAPDSDTEVTLTATITKGEVTDTATVTFLCKGIVSIASIKASEDLSQKFVIKGNVIAVSQISFIVQDGSGYIYVYYGSNFAQDLEIGDEVVVRGYVSIYNELYEFSSEVGYTKTGESITVTNTPDELDGEAFDLLGNTTGFRYIKITGDYYYDGRYHTFYPVGSENCVANLVRPLVDGLDEVNGERLIITGYYCFAEGQDPRYLNIVVTGFEVYEWTDEELVNDAVRGINDIQNYPLVAGVTITFGDRYTVTWTSSHENILSSSFEYHVPEVDTLVTMTATITVGEVTDTASCTFLCKAPSTIASVIASESHEERCLVKGTVIAVSATCFLVEDDTAKILVYYGDKFAQDLEVGDEVYVRGYLTTYNGTLQFGANVGYEKTGEKNDVEYPEATLLSSEGFDALLETAEIVYAKVRGTLQVSGNYYNFVVDGASYRGSIVNPTDKLLRFVDGKEIELTGYYLYTTGSKERYISFIATNIDYEEVEVSYDYYITGTEVAYWQVNHDYKLQEMAVDSLVNHEFTNNYIKDELLAIATALGDKDVETVYVFEFEIAGENAEWSTGALIEGDYAEMNGSYAFKVVYAMEHESYGIYEDIWIPSPESEKAESLTPNTLFMPNNHQEQDDEFGFNWNSNPVITSGTGKYLLVFAKYNPELSDAGASYGFAVVKAITE